MRKYIKETYNDSSEQLTARDVAGDVHERWGFMAGVVQGVLNEQLKTYRNEIKMLEMKISLRNALTNLLDATSPYWLRQLTIKRKFKWNLVLQLETNASRTLKNILKDMEISVHDFTEELEKFFEESSRDIHLARLPMFDDENKMNETLLNLGFEIPKMRQTVIALAYRLRRANYNLGDSTNFCFLHFKNLKKGVTKYEEIIAAFLNLYFPNTVHENNITVIGTERDEDGGRGPDHCEAFIRFKKSQTTLNMLNLICEEYAVLKTKKPTQPPLKTSSSPSSTTARSTTDTTTHSSTNTIYSSTFAEIDFLPPLWAGYLERQSQPTTKKTKHHKGSSTPIIASKSEKSSFFDKCESPPEIHA
ncbi:uncharacterized protein LOC135841769 isoform X2 [Planococcus citri]